MEGGRKENSPHKVKKSGAAPLSNLSKK